MKLKLTFREPAPPRRAPRTRVVCPLCGHGTWSTHLEKHQKKLDCELGQRRLALYRSGFEPASVFYPQLKKAKVPLEKHATEPGQTFGGDPAALYRYWAPRWALAVCFMHAKQQRWQVSVMGQASVMVHNDAIEELVDKLRAAMKLSPETQEVLVVESRLFWKANVWHEESNEARETKAP